MHRQLEALVDHEFDLAIVGGGMFGACAAWDAAQRGLRVALIERGDFGGATSANCFKMVHGGIRYIQHGDLYRVRQSVSERRVLLKIAPHQVRPLPIVIPTYGRGLRRRGLLHLGIRLYDLLSVDRNRGITDPRCCLPASSKLSPTEVVEQFPDLEQEGLSGGFLFYDGQILSPQRLVFAIVQSAALEGAVVANYIEASKFLLEGRRVRGIEAQDRRSGETLIIRARHVLNAAGPYAESLLDRALKLRLQRPGAYSRDACFIVPRRLLNQHQAIAISGRTADPDALVSRGARHLFVVPWRDYTLIGVWHKVHRHHPDNVAVEEDELQQFLDETNEACPALQLARDDVSLIHSGLVPLRDVQTHRGNVRYGRRTRLIDHAREHGIDNLFTLIGVRFTTGRYEAARAVARICRRLGRPGGPGRTATTAVHGGGISDTEAYRQQVMQDTAGLDADIIDSLLSTYGDQWGRILRHVRDDESLETRIGNSSVIAAQIYHAVHEELAMTLEDVVFRRTDLATGLHPGRQALGQCAEIMGRELGWNHARREQEIDRVNQRFPYWAIDSTPYREPVDTASYISPPASFGGR